MADYTLTCDSGSFTVSGTAVSLRAARILGCSAGSFSVSGTSVSFRVARKLAAASGSYTLAGTAVSLVADRILSASSGSFVLTGTTIVLRSSLYADFFLNTSSSIVQLETLEISHSSFTQTYYVVRNAVDGITATDENGTSHDFIYYPLAIEPVGSYDDLDQSLRISLGDLGTVLPLELDAVTSAGGFTEKPIVKYRTYRSDNLTAVMFGPLILEVKAFTFSREGSQFEARAPSLNINRTGEIYTLERFPMLRGCL